MNSGLSGLKSHLRYGLTILTSIGKSQCQQVSRYLQNFIALRPISSKNDSRFGLWLPQLVVETNYYDEIIDPMPKSP